MFLILSISTQMGNCSSGIKFSKPLIFQDIKPENILIASGSEAEDDPFQIRVADFGLATFVDKCTMMENLVGTPL
jgi:serine/threonine protein kinase